MLIISFLFETDKEMYKRLKIDSWAARFFMRMHGVLKDIQGHSEEKRQEILEKHLARAQSSRYGGGVKDGKLVYDCWSHWLFNGRYFISLTGEEKQLIGKLYPIWKVNPGLPLKLVEREDTVELTSATTNLGVLMSILFLRTCNAGKLPGKSMANELIDMANDKMLSS